jgi:ectoine hydroxylase-related dioxygenase (phytanoyl-CoA dioxygenase family)
MQAHTPSYRLPPLPSRSTGIVQAPEPDIREELAALEDVGYVAMRDAVRPDLILEVADQLEPWLQATPKCEGDFYGWQTTRVGGLLTKTPRTREMVMHPKILAIAQALLGPYCDCIQLNLTQATRVHGGERHQAPHCDEEMWPLAFKSSPWLLNVMWPVSAFTRENGSTRLWPGSHRGAVDRNMDPAGCVQEELEPGAALVFMGSLTHSAGQNRTREPRTGIIISYCLGWLRQYENQYLAYPPEIARTFPPELQKLIGYQIHRPNLGGYEGQDPSFALNQTDSAQHPFVDALTPEIAQQLKEHYGG